MTTPPICTCQLIDTPELYEEYGHDVHVQVIKLDPHCQVHTGPPNPLCAACTDDQGPCVCAKDCGATTCTGGFT